MNIKDPEERDTEIAGYLALKKRLKERNLEERGELAARRRDLEKKFEPFVSSNRKMTEEIRDELSPITRNCEH